MPSSGKTRESRTTCIPGAREKTASGDLLFGNVDTFLLSNLTGGAKGGVHVTDVTNAGRTQPLSLQTLDGDESCLRHLRFYDPCFQVRSSSEVYGEASLPATAGVPIAGIRPVLDTTETS